MCPSSAATAAPVAPDPSVAPAIPSRRVLRQWLAGHQGRSTVRAVALLTGDVLLYLGCLAGVVLAHSLTARLAWGVLAGLVTGRLFILGHDACHQSLTPHHRLNRWLGRLAFLPSLTPYSLWDVGHNVVHHGYTNLKGVDFVWAPATPAEYAALPAWRRWLERRYRSGWWPGLYYLVEIWWLRMFFPAARHLAARRTVFLRDNLLVSAWALVWGAAMVALARATGQSLAVLLACGVLVPFLAWNTLIGFVVYVHHTHPAVHWYRDKADWAAAIPFVSTTVHLTFPRPVGALLHHIMEHTAHHVDMGIPLYHLPGAQAELEARLPGRIVVQPFSWRWYFATARHCQLYDLEARRWTAFAAG